MSIQYRRYQLKPGTFDQFVGLWSEAVVPLRRRLGFEVVGAWASEESGVFVWLVSHPDDFEAAERAYYDSSERAAMDPNPGDLIERSDVMMVEAVVVR